VEILKTFANKCGDVGRVLQRIEKFLPEQISFPSTRLYAYIAKRAPFMRDGYRELARKVGKKLTQGTVLDVGTGPGYLPLELVRLIQGIEVVGIDVSVDMVRIARNNARKEGLQQRVRFDLEDGNCMSYGDSSFDLVVSTGSFHHWKNPVKVLNEIHRVLKPGCEAWVYDLRKDAPAEDKEKLKERYGRLAGWLTYTAVTAHSGLTKEDLEAVLKNPENKFKTQKVSEDYPFFLEAVLSKK